VGFVHGETGLTTANERLVIVGARAVFEITGDVIIFTDTINAFIAISTGLVDLPITINTLTADTAFLINALGECGVTNVSVIALVNVLAHIEIILFKTIVAEARVATLSVFAVRVLIIVAFVQGGINCLLAFVNVHVAHFECWGCGISILTPSIDATARVLTINWDAYFVETIAFNVSAGALVNIKTFHVCKVHGPTVVTLTKKFVNSINTRLVILA